MSNGDQHIFVLAEGGKIPEVNFIKKAKFIAIPYILTVEFLFHRLSNKKVIRLFFSYYKAENKIKLVYLFATRTSTLLEINRVLDVMYNFGIMNHVGKIETLIVNPSLTNEILIRNGWKYVKREKIVGRLFEKIIT